MTIKKMPPKQKQATAKKRPKKVSVPAKRVKGGEKVVIDLTSDTEDELDLNYDSE